MTLKKYQARFVVKGDTESNWKKETEFIPLDRELIEYKPDESHKLPRFKIGDGKTKLNDLPFIEADQVYNAKSTNAQSGIAVQEAITLSENRTMTLVEGLITALNVSTAAQLTDLENRITEINACQATDSQILAIFN